MLVVDDENRAAELLTTALARAREACDYVTELRTMYNLASNRYYAGDLAGRDAGHGRRRRARRARSA